MRRFGTSGTQFLDNIHDDVAVSGTWCKHNHRIYIGTQGGSVVELSSDPGSKGRFYTTCTEQVHCLNVSEIVTDFQGSKIVSTSLDGTCVVSDSSLKPIREIECPEAISPHCAIQRNGELVVVVGAKSNVWLDNGSYTSHTVDTDGRPNDDFYKAVAFYGDDEDKFIALSRHKLSLFDVGSMTPIKTLRGSTREVRGELKKSINCIATLPSESLVAVGTVSGYIQFYDFRKERAIQRELKIGGELIEKLQFSDDGMTLLVAGSNHRITMLDMRSDGALMDYIDDKQKSRILDVSFNCDADKVLSICDDETVMIAPVVSE